MIEALAGKKVIGAAAGSHSSPQCRRVDHLEEFLISLLLYMYVVSGEYAPQTQTQHHLLPLQQWHNGHNNAP